MKERSSFLFSFVGGITERFWLDDQRGWLVMYGVSNSGSALKVIESILKSILSLTGKKEALLQ